MNSPLLKTFKVALYAEDSKPCCQKLLHGAMNYFNSNGCWDVSSNLLQDNCKHEKLEISQLSNFDGVIACIHDAKKAEALGSLNLPIIVKAFPPSTEAIIPVAIDYKATGKMAASYLKKIGFHQFAFAGFKDTNFSQQIYDSFHKKLNKPIFKVYLYDSSKACFDKDREKHLKLLAGWIKTLPKPIGIMACSDEYAYTIIEACNNLNLKIPEEIAIVGVSDDSSICSHTGTVLSSVTIDFETCGYDAAKLLEKTLKSKVTSSSEVIAKPINIEVRRSTDLLALDLTNIKDGIVAKAIKFICENSQNAITAETVADTVSMSKRTLDKRFQKAVGHSIHKEIKNVRVNQISKLLIETDKTITQIALLSGFESYSNLARYFQSVTSLTPKVYRKCYGRCNNNKN